MVAIVHFCDRTSSLALPIMGSETTKVIQLRWLEEEVQRTAREVSSKYVCEPTIDEVYNDVLIGLKRYQYAV